MDIHLPSFVQNLMMPLLLKMPFPGAAQGMDLYRVESPWYRDALSLASFTSVAAYLLQPMYEVHLDEVKAWNYLSILYRCYSCRSMLA